MRSSALIAALVVLLFACARDETPRVADPTSQRSLEQGDVVGFDLDGAHAWRGIPFAASAAGSGRWRPPRPPESWSETQEMLEFGSACPQLSFEDRSPIGDEDCLKLNVYAPRFESGEVPVGSSRLPVMVYVHGGGMSIGMPWTAVGSRLAADDGVIVVTISYRLGVLGWFSHPALQRAARTSAERSGNWGTLDVIRALEWVRDNVSAFGGDPDRVTVFGQSAGGIQTYSMLLSPRAKGLFQRALPQSGFPTTFSRAQAENRVDDPQAPGDPASSAEILLRLLVRDGRAVDRTQAISVAEAMEGEAVETYLRGKSPDDLLGIFRDELGSLGGIYVSPFAIRDGYVLPEEEPEGLLASGAYNRVPVIVGTTRDEMKSFLSQLSPHVSRIGKIPVRFNNEARYDRVTGYGSQLWKALGADEPATRMARHQDVWVYRFDWDELGGPFWISFSRLFGASHGTELPFVFGSVNYAYMPSFFFEGSGSFASLSRQIRSYWAEFAASGDPGRGRSGDLPEWKPWDADAAGPFVVLDSPEDGGLRLSSDSITRDELLRRVASDTSLEGVDERCEVYRVFVQWSDTFTPAEYEALEDGICRDHPLPGRTVFE